MLTETPLKTAGFLSEGGEMGRLIREKDWTAVGLGPADSWPPCLKISVSIMLRSSYPMFVWWGPERIMFYNDAYLPVVGNKHPHVLGRSAREGWSEIWDQVGPMADEVFAGKDLYRSDLLLYLERKGFSEETYWTFSYSPIVNEDGVPLGLFCACNEETRKIIGQRRLKSLQEITSLSMQCRDTVDVGKAAMNLLSRNPRDIPSAFLYLWNEQKGNLELVSSYGEDKLGNQLADQPFDIYSRFQSKESDVLELKHVGDNHLKKAFVIPLLRPGKETPLGILICGLSTNLEFSPDYQDYCQVMAGQISGAIMDVETYQEERRKSEMLLEIAMAKEKAEHDLYNLFMQAPVGILILEGPDYVVQLVNESYLPIVDRSYDELIGTRIFESVPEVASQGFREILDHVRKSGNPFVQHEHLTSLKRSGEVRPRYLSLVYQPMKTLDETVEKVMVLVLDMTDQVIARKKMEQLNHFLESEVNSRTRDLQQANTELERSNQELEQFAYAASHDMQEPLRKIQTFASFLHDNSTEIISETNRKYILKIQESAKRMSSIIDDLLNYSYQNSDRRFAEVDLNKVVADVIFDLELLITQKNADVQVGDLPTIEGISAQMHQLFYNLINNSLKFSRVDVPTRISITSRTVVQPSFSEYAEITVSDNGIGFEPEYAEKIFQLFKRLNDRHSYAGSGIGLALCKKIAHNHNGSILAKSEPNAGASFIITLPLHQ